METEQIEKIQNSEMNFPKVTLWEKGNKSRIYVDGAGYITEDGDDVKGNLSDFYNGFWYQANRPGKVGELRDIIRVLTN
jgi:hypothetical protein